MHSGHFSCPLNHIVPAINAGCKPNAKSLKRRSRILVGLNLLGYVAFCGCRKCYDRKQLGEERVHLVYVSQSQFIAEGGLGRNSSRNIGRIFGGTLLTGLLPCLAQLAYLKNPGTPFRVLPPTLDLSLPHQL